ncbi:unnamed protein product [Moneuplotes crassus]|uniref:Uncharacterized protein n=1 Tax=Euplotes crassus TaxID=5936 RepID=A0AAD1X6N5_EUPCR|nr:unnamed protein product [Moneuplotes crassus]
MFQSLQCNFQKYIRPLIGVGSKVIVEISNSSIHHISSAFESIAYVISPNSVLSFVDCNFYSNSAISGGVFQINSKSSITCHRCNITDNFAFSGGVISSSLGGSFMFTDSFISHNYAFATPIAVISESDESSVISNCNISENFRVSEDYIKNEHLMQNHIPSSFREYVNDHSELFLQSESSSMFSLMAAELTINNETRIMNQSNIVSSINSNINIQQMIILNGEPDTALFRFIESNVTVEKLEVDGTTQRKDTNSFIFSLIDSQFTFINSRIYNIGLPIISSTLSNTEISNLTIDSVNSTRSLFKIWVKTVAKIEGVKINSVQTNSSIFSITDSTIKEIKDIYITNIPIKAFEIFKSEVMLIENVNMINISRGIHFCESNVTQLTLSTFESCGSENLPEGAALLIEQSNATITQSVFRNNKADMGGAISIKCNIGTACHTLIVQNNFSSNSARVQGGAINYNYNQPELVGLIHESNSAPYGPDIGSYAADFIFKATNTSVLHMDQVGSGIYLDHNIEIQIIDHEYQVMNQINENVLRISPHWGNYFNQHAPDNLGVLGIDTAKIVNGAANFSNIALVAPPGQTNITFHLFYSEFDYTKIIVLNEVSEDEISEHFPHIVANFRFCQPGEMQADQKCVQCDSLTYSLDWNQTYCANCVSNADCLGQQQISVQKGYWRNSTNSTSIVECLRSEACLGGYHPENTHPVKCSEGYYGVLCSQCQVTLDSKYYQERNFKCTKCPSKIVNAIQVFCYQILVLIFLFVMIIVNFKKKDENQLSILMRILTNYIQLISAVMMFQIDFSATMSQMFRESGRVNSADSSFFSFDCFLEDYELKLFAPNTVILKLSLYVFLPLIILAIIMTKAFLFRVVMHFTKPYKKYCMKRLFVISVLSIMILMHPNMVYESLRIFQCVKVDANDYRMIMNMDNHCYSSDHIKWILIIGIPLMATWVITFPVCINIILYKHRANLHEHFVYKYFLIVYQGLKPSSFYWEGVNSLRKTMVVALSVFLSTYDPHYKVLFSIVWLFAILKIQQAMKPYKNNENNKIDELAIVAGIITIYYGIVFIQEQTRTPALRFLSLCVILIGNAAFLLQWTYLVCKDRNYSNKCFRTFMKIFAFVLCKEFESPLVEPRPKLKSKKDIIVKKRVYGRKYKRNKASRKSRFKPKSDTLVESSRKNVENYTKFPGMHCKIMMHSVLSNLSLT